MLKNVKKIMEDWKENILNSTKGMGKAHPPKEAFDQILLKISKQNQKTEPARGWLAIAATVSLIALLNAYVIVNYAPHTDPEEHRDSESYTSLVTDYNLYDNEK
jgi:hypothetical protein